MALRTIDSEMMLSLAPSVQKLTKIDIIVDEIESDDIVDLFEACSNVESGQFLIRDYHSVEDATKYVEKLVRVAWTKKNLSYLEITFQTEEENWDESEKALFDRRARLTVQKRRLRRCVVNVGYDAV